MATCSECKCKFRTLEDEMDMHECPDCGYHPKKILTANVKCSDCGSLYEYDGEEMYCPICDNT